METMCKSEKAVKYNISNIPPDDIIENLKALALNIYEPVYSKYGDLVVVTSGYRSPELNKKVGGSARSQHMLGEAIDFEIIGVSNYDFAEWIKSNLTFDQLILEKHITVDPNSGWVHCSYTRGNNRRLVL
ncbi:peptidase M15A [Candidatus Magnetobacterium bavaricum]|uniref:Peptidase M15A n=1 Tax=Candidatus Magnetobacterium bavaricum TaxID=29290 RepID=A0A0F3GVV3_9BACT|nr:peptidase M15A [Candidatus Magnetobacterium bavaricum]